MRVVHQANAGGHHIYRDGNRAGDILVAGLGVIALVRDVADDVDTASADQVGGAAIDERGVEVVRDAVVFNHRAVAVGEAVQAFAVAVGGDLVAEQAGQDNAVAELARGAEQQNLFVDRRWVPLSVGAGPQGNPRQPGGGQRSGFDLHTRGLHLDGCDSAEADEVFDQAGEGG